MATWPATLPQCFERGNVERQYADNRLRSPVDVGPAKVRRRSSLNVGVLAGTMIMTQAQKDTLDTFVDSTSGSGVLSFDFPDPESAGATIEVRFGQRLPVAQRFPPTSWRVSFELEVLP